MRLTIQIRKDVARALHRGAHTPASKELLDVIGKLGLVLEPLHPGASDPSLIPHFVTDVPLPVDADQIVSRLQGCKAIEAAYFKPPDELP